MSDLFGTEIQLLTKALDFRSERNSLTAANLANADTPGYKAVQLKFEEALKAAAGNHGQASILRTHPQHLSSGTASGGTQPEIVTKMETDRRDDNSVDVDRELVTLSTNQILYNANAETLSRLFSLLEYVIEEGGR